MKKVLFVIPYLYEGGAQSLLDNIQMHLPDDWVIETLVNSEYNRAYSLKGTLHTLKVDDTPRTASVLFQAKVFLRRVKRLKELKRIGNYDACISLVDSANVSNIISGRKYCRTVITVVTSLKSFNKVPQYRYIVNPIAKLLYNRADTVVAVSEELKRELVVDYGIDESKAVAIPIGCNRDAICKQKKEGLDEEILRIIENKKVICNVGRLSYAKGQWHLIRAFKSVLAVVPDAVLMIVGDGEKRRYLNDVINKLDLSGRVLLTGRVDSVYKYVNLSDVFVFPSILEGFPNALAEALCVGIPCIATDFKTGAREILAPELLFKEDIIDSVTECKYGVLTPKCSGVEYSGDEPLEDSEMELSRAIIMMLTQNNLNAKYREMSRKRAQDLDIEKTVEKWVSMLEQEG